MVDNSIYDFERFSSVAENESYIKNVVKKQVDLFLIFYMADPNNETLRLHYQLMQNIYDSNFHKVLASRLNTSLTVNESAYVFAQILQEQVDNTFFNEIIRERSHLKKMTSMNNFDE